MKGFPVGRILMAIATLGSLTLAVLFTLKYLHIL